MIRLRDASGSPPAAPVRDALGNRDVVRVVGSFASSTTAEWALWTAVLVHVHDAGSARAAGLASLAMLVPAGVVAPRAGRAGDGHRPAAVLAGAYLVEALGVLVAAAAVAARWPLPTVVAGAATAALAVSFVRPCQGVVLPDVARSADELVAANVMVGDARHGAALAGPSIAAVTMAGAGRTATFVVIAALHLAAALSIAPLARGEHRSAAASAPAAPATVRSGASTRRVAGALAGTPGGVALLGAVAVVHVMCGALDLLVVVVARDALDLGPSAPGLLTTAIGVGALLGAASATLAVARRTLALPVVVGLATCGLALASVAVTVDVPWVVVALVVIGWAQAVTDVLAGLLVLRIAPAHTLGSVYGVIELLGVVGLATGSLLTQLLLPVGVAAAALVVACCPLLVAGLGARALRRIDDVAAVPTVALATLRKVALFAVMPPLALEEVARAAVAVDVPAGEVVFREGSPGDAYYAVAAGTVAVSLPEGGSRTMSKGEGFGEIALLAPVPRTATVRAVDDVRLLRIPRAEFLAAVTGFDAVRVVAVATAGRYVPTMRFEP